MSVASIKNGPGSKICSLMRHDFMANNGGRMPDVGGLSCAIRLKGRPTPTTGVTEFD